MECGISALDTVGIYEADGTESAEARHFWSFVDLKVNPEVLCACGSALQTVARCAESYCRVGVGEETIREWVTLGIPIANADFAAPPLS